MMRGPRGPRSAGNFKFIFSCPTTNFKTMQKFLSILAFEIDFTGLNDLSLNEDVDETKRQLHFPFRLTWKWKKELKQLYMQVV